MNFDLNRSFEILERTPATLRVLLTGLSSNWCEQNEGPDTWSAYDVVGHLVHGEKTDWIPRAGIILSDRVDKSFEPFDRFAQVRDSTGKSLTQLLDEFEELRKANLRKLLAMEINQAKLDRIGSHPAFGDVTLRQLLATWVVHDLNHLSQIARVMATQYKSEVGPWVAYLGILNRP